MFVWLMAGADLFWEKNTTSWLLVAGLLWEKSTAGWWLISQANRVLIGEAVLPNFFQNGFGSIRKAAPPKEQEPEPFLEEPKPCQTGPYSHAVIRLQSYKCVAKVR
jgi:hypothetical protein